MSYIANPTRVLIAYLNSETGEQPRTGFHLGRLAMALEITTVVKTIEDELVPMLSLTRSEITSVLVTLLRDQELTEVAEEWYERLSQWRNPSFVVEPSLSRTDGVDAPSPPPLAVPISRLEALREAVALHEHTVSPPGTDRSLDQALDESARRLAEVDESMLNE